MSCVPTAFQPDAFQNDAFQVGVGDPMLCGGLTATLTPVNVYKASLTPNNRESPGTVPVTFQ